MEQCNELKSIDLDEFFNDLETLKEYRDESISSCCEEPFEDIKCKNLRYSNKKEVIKDKYESKILKSGNNLLIKLWNNIMN